MKNKIVCLLVWLAAFDPCHPVVAGGVNGTMKKEPLEKHRHALCGNSCHKDNSCYKDFAFDPEKDLIQVISPGQVRVQGDLYDRMQKAVAYLDKAKPEEIWNGFNEGFWGADFSGRMLEAYSRLSLSGAGSERFAEIGENLLARQSLDGSFHNGKALSLYEKEAGFWFGNARGMMGLLWAYRFSNDERYLKAARELGDYYVSNYFNKKINRHPGSFSWVATEAMAFLHEITKEKKYLDLGLQIAKSVPDVFMSSQHTHSYLLSIRGIVQIYEQTGDEALLDKAIRQYAVFKERVMWPGGGIVEHLGDTAAQNVNYWYDEGCSVADWLGLNFDLWRISRDPQYLDMVERIALNHLLFDQDKTGGFCGDRSVDFVREGAPWPFCCAMHGARALSEISQYIAASDGNIVFANLFYPSAVTLSVKDQPVKLVMSTSYPNDGYINLAMSMGNPQAFPLKVRIPSWSKLLRLKINGKTVRSKITGGYLEMDRLWKEGDKIELFLDLPLRTEKRNNFIGNDSETDQLEVTVWKGPRQLVYNQSLNIHLWKERKIRTGLSYVYQVYDSLQMDRSVKGTPLRIRKKEYSKGLGVHAVSELEYVLNGEFSEFVSDIGIDNSAEGKGAVRFRVCVDGLMRAGTGSMASVHDTVNANIETMYGFNVSGTTGKDEARTIRVNTSGAHVLRLVVDDAVDGFSGDYANWAGAKLIRNDGSEVYISDLPDNRMISSAPDWGLLRLEQINDPGQAEGVVTLLYDIPGSRPLPIRFNYLADLGYSLIEKRPVLDSWIRVKEKKGRY